MGAWRLGPPLMSTDYIEDVLYNAEAGQDLLKGFGYSHAVGVAEGGPV